MKFIISGFKKDVAKYYLPALVGCEVKICHWYSEPLNKMCPAARFIENEWVVWLSAVYITELNDEGYPL